MKKEGLDINFKDSNEFTGLHYALDKFRASKTQSELDNHKSVVEFLLKEKPVLDDLHMEYLNTPVSMGVTGQFLFAWQFVY